MLCALLGWGPRGGVVAKDEEVELDREKVGWGDRDFRVYQSLSDLGNLDPVSPLK